MSFNFKDMSKEEFEINMLFRILNNISIDEDEGEDKYNRDFVSKDNVNFLLDKILTNDIYCKKFLDACIHEYKLIYIITKSKEMAEYFISTENVVEKVINFSPSHLESFLKALYNHNLQNEAIDLFMKIYDDLRNYDECDVYHFLNSITEVGSNTEDANEFVIGMTMMFILNKAEIENLFNI